MASRKIDYTSSSTVEKLMELEGVLRVMLDDPELASPVRVQAVQQLAKLAGQIETLRPAEVENGDPIEAIKIRAVR